MSKISPTLIGGFVLGALVLLVIAVIAFGSGRLFRNTREFVLYFDSSVNGLRVGAPVKFKGVEVGSVKDIRLQLERDLEVSKIPVIIEIDLEKLTSKGATAVIAEDRPAFQKAVVDRGLRGQLLMESLVTGLLYVGLDFFPKTPITLVQQQPDGNYQYPEIPTIPTNLERVQDAVSRIINKLEEIDFKALTQSLTETVTGVNQLVNSPALKASLENLQQTLPKVDQAVAGIHKLTTTLDGNVARLSENLEQTSTAARLAVEQMQASLKQTETTINNVQAVTDPNSPTFYELKKTLREVSAAARSLRLLSNYLERNPRALISGRPDREGP